MELDRNTVIKDLEQEELYKYLGVDKSHGIQYVAMTQKKNSQKSRKKSRQNQLCKSHKSNKHFGNTCCSI